MCRSPLVEVMIPDLVPGVDTDGMLLKELKENHRDKMEAKASTAAITEEVGRSSCP